MQVRPGEFEPFDAQQRVTDEFDRLGPGIEEQLVGGDHRVPVRVHPDQAHLDVPKPLLAVTAAERLLRPSVEDKPTLFVVAGELDLGRNHLFPLNGHLVGGTEPLRRPPFEALLEAQHHKHRKPEEGQHRQGRPDPSRPNRRPTAARALPGAGRCRHASQPVPADWKPAAPLSPAPLSPGGGASPDRWTGASSSPMFPMLRNFW